MTNFFLDFSAECSLLISYSSAGTHIRRVWEGGETPPNDFRVGPKIVLVNEKSVHDIAWLFRIQVGPTSECFRPRSVHDDGWKFYK